MKSFSQWTIEEVENEFQLQRVIEHPRLAGWLSAESEITQQEQQQLERLQKKLERRIYAWNEQELTNRFISPLVSMVDFEQDEYNIFMERELSAPYQDDKLSGTVDFLVAQGDYSPKRPYFFIHEYKKEQESSNDPLGQLMITMVAAQMLNQNNNPIYGAYVRGRLWHFVVLHDKEYAVHFGFNALQADIVKILGALKAMQGIIDNMVREAQNR